MLPEGLSSTSISAPWESLPLSVTPRSAVTAHSAIWSGGALLGNLLPERVVPHQVLLPVLPLHHDAILHSHALADGIGVARLTILGSDDLAAVLESDGGSFRIDSAAIDSLFTWKSPRLGVEKFEIRSAGQHRFDQCQRPNQPHRAGYGNVIAV